MPIVDSPTLILCPRCATSYRVEPASLGPVGRSVRCTRCRTVWFATRQGKGRSSDGLGDKLAQAAHALAPDAPAAPAFTSEPADMGNAMRAASADSLSAHDPAVAALAPELQAPSPATALGDIAPIEEAPSIVPPADQLAGLPTALPEPAQADGDIESFAARRERLYRQRRQRSAWKFGMPALPGVILGLVAAITIVVGWRSTIVRYAPQTAALYDTIGLPVNLRGLVFDNLKTSRETQDGVPVLVVEGRIGSKSRAPVDVPRLRFAVRNAKGDEIYSWTAMPSRTILAPGESLDFRSRLASPPVEAQDVAVRFFTRYDVQGGMR
jgi:predicted Zn finger-like uncharacterized protein